MAGSDAASAGPAAALRVAESTGEERRPTPSVAAIIPLFDECASLDELHSRLTVVLRRLCGDRYEIIFVDDGSTDGSAVELCRFGLWYAPEV
jgi:hypothetical protein